MSALTNHPGGTAIEPMATGPTPPDRTDVLAVRLARRAARLRADLYLALLDALLVTCAFVGVLVLRFDGSVPGRYWTQFVEFLPAVLVLTIGFNAVGGLYGRLWRHASVAEAQALVAAGIVTATSVTVVNEVAGRVLPLSVAILGPFVATFLTGAVRFQSRLLYSWRRHDEPGSRVVVIGAGDAGAALAHEMIRSPGVGLTPVAFLDDDLSRHHRRTMGLPIEGGVEALPSVARRYGADQAVFAITSATGDTVTRAVEAAERAGVPLRIVPGMAETLLSGKPSLRDLRDVRIEDLIGRAQVETDLEAVRALVQGRRVLVTGAGGSIGSEIARQVAALGPDSLVLFDREETLLHDVATSLGKAPVPVLGNVRDGRGLAAVFDAHRPDVVFHAAALKHVPILEDHPAEAVATNVLGTVNVANECRRTGVVDLVLVSTDKAVQPHSVMGASKRIAEQVVLGGVPEGARWCAVRFGNVLGSRGSVIPTFMRQIEEGGPVTVTDEHMTRYFMSTREAVQLVLQAAALAEGGDLFALEMGRPVRIIELAERMIRLSGRRVGIDIEIDLVGARPGERLDEQVWLEEERPEATAHPSVMRMRRVVASDDDGRFETAVDRLVAMSREGSHEEVRRALFDVVELVQRGTMGDRAAEGDATGYARRPGGPAPGTT